MLLNREPSTGTDPSQGSCERRRVSWACNRPAIAKLCPSRNSIVVIASRLISDGTVVPEIVTALEKSSSLTSGAIRRLIKPFWSTVGVNDSRTPNGLNSMVGVTSPFAEVAAIAREILRPQGIARYLPIEPSGLAQPGGERGPGFQAQRPVHRHWCRHSP